MCFFKKTNKFDICPKVEELKSLVTNYSGHGGVIKINGKLFVPENYDFLIGKKGKVTDKFSSGEHFFSFSNLPYSCRKFGIDKMENGKQKTTFPCNYYFVNKNLMAGKFKTYRKVEMGTRAYGMFKVGVYGMYSYKVTNTHELMQSLLNEFDYIKTGEAESIIESWVDDLVVPVLEKNNFMIDDVVANSPIIAEKLKQAISKLFVSAGLEIVDVKIYKYKLPKQYQEQSDKIIAEQNNINNKLENAKQDIKEEVAEQSENTEVKEKADENNQDLQSVKDENLTLIYTQEELEMRASKEQTKETEIASLTAEPLQNEEIKHEYVPFGNFVIKEESEQDANNIINLVKNEENKPKERTFVDLNIDKLYDTKEQKIKRCLRCGGENDINADHCILCGEKFFEEEGE